MLLLCVCENVCVRFSLLNVWSMKVEKSMRFHFVCYLIYTDTCPLIYMKFYIYTPLSIWVHLHVLLQRRACVLTFEVCVLLLTQLATYMTSFTHLTMKYQYVVEIFISGKHQHWISTVNIYNILYICCINTSKNDMIVYVAFINNILKWRFTLIGITFLQTVCFSMLFQHIQSLIEYS